MEKLTVGEKLPNTKDWANSATRILNDLIQKHNKLVDEVEKLKNRKVERPMKWMNPNDNL